MHVRSSRRTHALLCAGLALLTIAVYARVGWFDFVNFDDAGYIYDNRHVLKGLSIEGVGWAFTTTQQANWHPLTWLSLMLDAEIAGRNAGLYHVHNLLLHLASTLLLFGLLYRMTGAVWRSAFVAALFAVHPLHVESVAWVSERKDVLSTVFWMLTTWAYLSYVRRPRAVSYAAMILVYALGLMAKPMLVSLPVVLLILDYWPLGRLQVRGYRLQEKLPLFALSAVSCIVTYLAQAHGETVARVSEEPLGMRLGNAVVSYAMYFWKTVWPSELAVFYPMSRHGQPAWLVAVAAVFLAAVSVLAWRARGRFPFVLAGWLWYVVTLIPVAGLVQVGMQARADRYTYIPLIGLFIIIGWLVPEATAARSEGKSTKKARTPARGQGERWLSAVAMAAVIALAAGAWRQVCYWKGSATLARRGVAVVKDNYMAHMNLGVALAEKGMHRQAIDHYEAALAVSPPSDAIHGNLGSAYSALGDMEQAISHYAEAIKLKPRVADHHANLGAALISLGQAKQGIAECEEALRLDPDNLLALNQMAYGLIAVGTLDEAEPYCARVLQTYPRDPDAYVNQGLIELRRDNPTGAEESFRTAVEIEPGHADAHNNLGAALAHQDRFDEAIGEFRRAIRLEPDRADFRRNLEKVLSVMPGHER